MCAIVSKGKENSFENAPRINSWVLRLKTIFLKIDDDTYRKLEELARKHGLLSASEAAKIIIARAVKGEEEGRGIEASVGDHTKRAQSVAEKLIAIVERRLLDKINPFTSKVDEIARRLAMVIERLEAVEDKISDIERRVKELESTVIHRQASMIEKPRLTHLEETEKKEGAKRRSILEILRDQGILFESDIANRIRDRDRFFAKLKRLGAVVLELKNERVAIDPDFWNRFVEKVQSISTSIEDEIAGLLDEKEMRLFKALKESALIYFDRTSNRWRLLI